MKNVYFLLALASLSSLSVAGTIEQGSFGLVVRNGDTGQQITRCMLANGSSMTQLLLSTGMVSLDPEDGHYVVVQVHEFCVINGWGIPCFQVPTTWHLYRNGGYLCGGGYVGGAVCADYTYPSSQDVVGFLWCHESEGCLPEVWEMPAYEQICRKDDKSKVKYPEASVKSDSGKYCAGEPITISFLYAGAPVWYPTYSYELGEDVNGFLLRMVYKSSPTAYWEFKGYFETNEEGEVTFTPEKAGAYEVTGRKAGYVTQVKSFTVENC